MIRHAAIFLAAAALSLAANFYLMVATTTCQWPNARQVTSAPYTLFVVCWAVAAVTFLRALYQVPAIPRRRLGGRFPASAATGVGLGALSVWPIYGCAKADLWSKQRFASADTSDAYLVVTLLVGFVALPLLMRWAARRLVSEPRPPSSICGQCGYDLRASTGRCPECGTPIPAEAGERLAAPKP